MTYKGILEKCKTQEELMRCRDNILAQSASPFDDSIFSKFIFSDIKTAYEQVCNEKGWDI